MLLSQVPVPSLPLHRFHPTARVTIMPMVPSLPLHRISPDAIYTTSRRQRCNLPTSKSMPTNPTPRHPSSPFPFPSCAVALRRM